jgi:transposase
MKAHPIELREKIIETYENEPISQVEIARQFRVAQSVVTRLLSQYRRTKKLEPKPRPGRPKIMSEGHLQILSDMVKEKPDITLGELCRAMDEKEKVKVSASTMSRMMEHLKLTRKKKSLHPTEKGSERVQGLRCEYWDLIKNVKASDLIFIDESGVNLGLIRLFAWALQGKRAYGEQPRRGKNVSIVAGLSLNGVVASAVIMGAFDKLTFEAFISTRLVPKLWPGACVVIDNCSIHREDEIRPMIEAAQAKLVYLPPYSPDFSPIENFWSKVKSILKTLGARTYPALLEFIEKAFKEASETDIRNWFCHSCYISSDISDTSLACEKIAAPV